MADNTIDSLALKISASSKGAERALDKLAESLLRMSNSISLLQPEKLNQLSNAVSTFSQSLVRFSTNTKTQDFTRIANGLQKIAAINVQGLQATAVAMQGLTRGLNNLAFISFDSQAIINIANGIGRLGRNTVTQAVENIPKLTTALKGLAEGIKTINGMDFDISGLAQLTSSITKLGGKSATAAADGNILKLANALKQMMITLSGAPQVSSNLIQMTQALAQLASAGGRAGTATNSLVRSFNMLPNSTKRAHKSMMSLASAFGRFYATYWLAIRALRQFKKAIDISSDITEVQNVVDTTFGNMAHKVDELAEHSIEDFGMSELTVKQISSRFQAMGSAMQIDKGLISEANSYLAKQTNGYVSLSDSMADVSINLTKLTADMASFYNVGQKDVAKDLEAIFTGQTRPMREYGIDLTQATLKEWAMSQGMKVNMKTMTQAEKTMLRYQYVLAHTGAAQGDFLRTSDTWANQIRILTQSFQQLGGIVGGVLINAFKPFIKGLNSVMKSIISFAQVVSDALGAIFGWKYEKGGGFTEDLEDGAGAAEDIEDATGGAADNAKKMKQYIAGWHEVNNMTSDNSDKDGSGGSGGAGSGADGGQWVQTESLWEKYTSDIDSLYELGDYISGVLTSAMNDIDWDSIYESARGFGSGLASFLNGLISPELFGAIGRTIAGALNTVIYAALSFGENFAWKNFGQSIYTGVNEFFETFDFASLADTINVWAKGILDALIFALDRIDWELIGTQMGTFLEKIDFFDIGKKIGIALWKAINGGINMAKSMFNIAPVETTILTAFVGIMAFNTITGIVAKTIGKLAIFIAPLTSMFTTIGSFFSAGGIFSATGPIAAASAPVLALAAAFAVLVAGLGAVFATNEQVRNSFATAVLTIQEGLTPIIQFMTNTLLPGLNNGWNELLNILKPLGEFLEQVFTDIWIKVLNPALEYIGETVLPMLSDTFNNVWNNVLVPFGEFLSSVLNPVIEMLSSVLTFLWKNVGIPLIDFLGGVFTAHFEGIAAVFNNFVVPAVNKMIDVFQFLWNNVFVPIGDILQNNLQPRFETAFNVISGIIDGFGTSLRGLIQFITGVFSGDWETAWQGVQNIFKGVFNGIISIAEGAVNFIIDSLNKLSFDIPDWVPEFGGETFGFDIEKVKLPRLAKGGIVSSPTIALIGESGSEAVIPIERNTQWISKVADNMSKEFGRYKLNTYVPQPDFSPTSYDLGKFRSTMQMEMDARIAEQQWEIRQQNDLLREQNELLRGIYNKPILSDDDVFNATRRGQNKFQRRTFRTGWAGID